MRCVCVGNPQRHAISPMERSVSLSSLHTSLSFSLLMAVATPSPRTVLNRSSRRLRDTFSAAARSFNVSPFGDGGNPRQACRRISFSAAVASRAEFDRSRVVSRSMTCRTPHGAHIRFCVEPEVSRSSIFCAAMRPALTKSGSMLVNCGRIFSHTSTSLSTPTICICSGMRSLA